MVNEALLLCDASEINEITKTTVVVSPNPSQTGIISITSDIPLSSIRVYSEDGRLMSTHGAVKSIELSKEGRICFIQWKEINGYFGFQRVVKL